MGPGRRSHAMVSFNATVPAKVERRLAERFCRNGERVEGRGDSEGRIEMRVRQVPTIPVSWGEAIDKITILELKRKKLGSHLRNPLISRTALFRRFFALTWANPGVLRPVMSVAGPLLDNCETRTRSSGLVMRESSHQTVNLQLLFGPRKNEGMA